MSAEAMQPIVKNPAYPSPVVLDSPHSGREYPPDFEHACPIERLRHVEDFLVDELYAFAPELGAPLICAPFPRTYIDVNRAPEDIDPELLSPAERGNSAPSANSELGMGLFWRLLSGNEAIYDRLLTRAELNERIRRCWRPYHAALQRAILAAHQRHGYSLHVNCHSMPAHSRLYPAELANSMPFDFVVGDRNGTTSSTDLTQRVAQFLESEGFVVGVNQIFSGAELVRRHGDPLNNRHSIQLEINKKLYMDERRLTVHDGFLRIQQTLRRLVQSLVTMGRLSDDEPSSGPAGFLR